jgi:hypothetical protein
MVSGGWSEVDRATETVGTYFGAGAPWGSSGWNERARQAGPGESSTNILVLGPARTRCLEQVGTWETTKSQAISDPERPAGGRPHSTNAARVRPWPPGVPGARKKMAPRVSRCDGLIIVLTTPTTAARKAKHEAIRKRLPVERSCKACSRSRVPASRVKNAEPLGVEKILAQDPRPAQFRSPSADARVRQPPSGSSSTGGECHRPAGLLDGPSRPAVGGPPLCFPQY